MNILVCVKQVPDTTEIKIDPVKNTLIRDGVPSIVNPFDGYALSTPFQNVDFRRNGMSFFTGQHTGVIQPYTPHHLPV